MPRLISLGSLLAITLTATQCAHRQQASLPAPAPVATGPTSRGHASWYSVRTNGRRTASGIPFSDHELTAAHRSLPFGTVVRVTNEKNGRSQIVRITDRGPFIRGRIIDVSKRVAEDLGMINAGVVPVVVEVVGQPNRA